MNRPQKKAFRVPNKYGPQPIVYPRRDRRPRRGARGRGRGRGGFRAPPRPQIDFSIGMRPMGMNMPPPMMPIPSNIPQQMSPSNLPPMIPNPNTQPNMYSSTNPMIPPVPPSLWIPPMNSGNNSSIPRMSGPVVPAGFALGHLVGPQVVNVSPEPKGQVKHPDVIKKEEEIEERRRKNLPEEISHKNIQKKTPKEVKNVTVVRSPEWIALKSERTFKTIEVEQVRK